MSLPVKLGFVPASRTLFDQELAITVRDDVMESLRAAGVAPVAPGPELTANGLVQTPEEARKTAALFEDSGVAGVVVGALNFGNEIPAALAALGRVEKPVLLFGIGEEGRLTRGSRRDAFCGLISIATALRHREARFCFPRRAIAYPRDFTDAFAEFARVCRAVDGVRGAVYGQIGPRPADFESCVFDEVSLLRKLGIRVAPLPLSTVYSRADSVAEARVRDTFADMDGTVNRGGASDLELSRMARMEVTFEDIIAENGLDGLAVQCWTSFQDDYGISPCFAMARLTERGIPCACEADVHGALSMHLLSLLAGSPAGLADWNNRHHEMDNVFSAWHCGVFPPSFSSGKKVLDMHRILAESTGVEEGKRGTLELSMDLGPVTMLRVTENPWEGWQVLLAEGEVIAASGEPFGSNGWVSVDDVDALYAEVLRGFPHHTAIARGKVGGASVVASYFLGLEPVTPLSSEEGHLQIGPAL
ncbi:MAG: hypothetical protein CVT63_02470 [Candidatus Anoxymicrobium japonicum]|uniref:L-fucose isomerase C-terminal domain-containing protein n=1 Tax=Candidatus Anoxymicrobium japonicum TaxID=2013648 RepID=A0A2N3G794_9ACTN|nr:MAG: hypothetical protein CVT63_02470 [Candidatus Anoxymicrobium japonicum]